MRTKYANLLLVLTSAFTAHLSQADVVHTSVTVAEIQPPHMGHDCVYFRLTGISQADPFLPNNPYFGLPRSHIGFKETYALLLAAYTSGAMKVSVRTTGSTASECGSYAAVAWLITG